MTQPNHRPSQALLKACLGASLVAMLALPFALQPRKTEKRSALPVRKLVIISPHWEGIRDEFGRAFSDWTEQNRGHSTTIEWIDVGGSSDDIRFVRSQFKSRPEGVGIDLFFGGGVDPFIQLTDDNLLLPCDVPAEILSAVPHDFNGIEIYDAQKRWFGACLAGFGIINNKKVLETLGLAAPQSWEDLGKPDYFTWVGSGDPRSSGSVHMVYEIILQAYGWEKGWATLVKTGGNVRSFSRAASQVPKDAAIGEVACGMAIDSYAWRQVAEVGPERMSFVMPEGATVINPDGIAVLKGAPNKELAEEFVAFVLSEAGQKLWVLKAGSPGGPKSFDLDRMPVIPGLAVRFGKDAAVTLDPFQWRGGFTYDPVKGSLRYVILNDLIGAYIIDTQGELINAWRKVKDLPSDDSRLAAFIQPPMPETDMLALARKEWKDPAYRAATRAAWVRDAYDRYRRIARGD